MNTSPKKRMDGIRPKTRKKTLSSIETKGTVDREPRLRKKPSPQRTTSVQGSSKSRSSRRISFRGQVHPYRRVPSVLVFFKNNWPWLRYVLAPLILIIAFFLVAESQTRASLHIQAHLEDRELTDTIRVYKNPPQNALGFDIIAVTNEETMAVQADGVEVKNIKAKGGVKIYNDHSSEPQTLSKGTRFLSSGGELFFLVGEAISVPGKTGESPGTLEVEVVAEHEGPHYNIEATRFSIPGFKEAGLEEKYNSIYAISTQKFEGGFSGSEPSVLPADRKAAEDLLKQKLSDKLRMRLSKENNDTVLIVANSAALRLQDPVLKPSDSPQTAVLSQKGTLVALALSQESLAGYLQKNYVSAEEGETIRVISTQGLHVSLEENDLDFTQELSQTVIAVSGEMRIKWGINHEELSAKIRGKKIDEMALLFEKTKSIDKVELEVFPPWKKRIPTDLSHIRISVD